MIQSVVSFIAVALLVAASVLGEGAEGPSLKRALAEQPPEANEVQVRPVDDEGPRWLIRHLTVSDRFIVFSYAGALWRVGREGGEAQRLLIDGSGEDGYPQFSPDGLHVAFSRRAGGDWDVYVVGVLGGVARRLTYNPEADIVRGWSPDGKQVLFMSHRDEQSVFRLYTIPADGVFPTPLPLPRGYDGSFSSDGERIAYVPVALPLDLNLSGWRYYRGGMASRIWVARLKDSSVEKMPREESNDRNPMWVGNTIYFVSDRTGTFNLHAYDPKTKQIEQLTSYEKYGVGSASAGDGVIAFAQDGRIRLYDMETREARTVELDLSSNTSQLEPRTATGARWIQSADLAASGEKVVFGYRGEVVTFDVDGERATNLTSSPGVADRYPVISPDGQWIGYVSDESGHYQIHVRPASGDGPVRKILTELRPSFYRELTWSPDSKKLAFTDKRLALWVADTETGGARRVTSSTYSDQGRYHPAWAPGGRILAYSRYHANRVRTIYLYDVVTGRKLRVTDGRVHAEFPVFDKSGKYLYFTASNTAPAGEFGWSVLSGVLLRPLVSRKLHLVVLEDGKPAPVLPIVGSPNPDALLDEETRTRVSARDIERRITPLPLSSRDYSGLAAIKPGVLLVRVEEWPEGPGLGKSPTHALYRYDLSKPQQLEKFIEGVDEFVVSPDGGKLLYRKAGNWAVVSTDAPPQPGDGRLELDQLQIAADPRAEWQQIYREAWRLMDAFFYDPNHHGQNLAELKQHYAEYLPTVTRRRDLNNLLGEALGHVSVSHLSIGGGDIERPVGPRIQVGLLGADYEIDEDRYRITRIYRSGHYNSPNRLVRAPLDQPGVKVTEGEYLLSVDGKPIHTTKNLYAYFEGKALKPVEIEVGPRRDGKDSRTYTVVPVPGENTLRRADWAERNREKVDELSGGKLGYVYVPNYRSGLQEFFRDVLGYIDRPGLIIDQRFASGGITSDFMVEMLKRRPLYYYTFREGDDLPVPTNPVRGSKVLLINELNGSAAETFAFMFKLGRVGQLVGQRTFGAGIGPYVFIPSLIDGGRISIPNRAAYNPIGKWGIENEGVAPDIEVEWSPSEWREGHDPQLQAAVNAALVHLADHPPAEPERPAYPVHP